MTSSCIVHYDGLTGEDEPLKYLWKNYYDILVNAKSSRNALGGGNTHDDQSRRIPASYTDNMFFHKQCYKKYTMAISMKRKKDDAGTSTSSQGSKRCRRSGELSTVLFPKHCMVCKKVIVTKDRKKKYPKVLELGNAEVQFKQAAEIRNDEEMLLAIRNISLRASEFKVHEHCRKEYTKVCPTKTKHKSADAEISTDNQFPSISDEPDHFAPDSTGPDDVDAVDVVNTAIPSVANAANAATSDTAIDVTAMDTTTLDAANSDASDPNAVISTRTDGEQLEIPTSGSYNRGNKNRLFFFIHENILEGGQCISMKTITDIYGFDGSDKRYRFHVKKILEEEFKGKLIILTISANEPQIVLRSADLHTSGSIFHSSNKNSIVKQAARIMRDAVDDFIKAENAIDKPWPPTVKSLHATRGRYPQILDLFFTELLRTKGHAVGETVQQAVASMKADVIHSVSDGSILTLKHTLVGCGIGSLSGLRLPIDIMYKLNNSCTYDKTREIGTAQAELAQEFAKGNFPLPVIPKDDSSKVLVHFWWDNFDSLKENKDGSIHTCHGVAYTEESNETVRRKCEASIPKTERRRSVVSEKVQLPEINIIPHKKPAYFDKEYPVSYNGTFATSLPLMWKLQRQLQSSNQLTSYRYVGYVSTVLKKNTPKTVLTFLPVIRNPITQYSTVLECIHQSMKYASSCNMSYVHITTDAGAASKFFQVIWNNQVEFKKVIIHLGDFHGMVEFFGIIGKFISGSGFEDVVYQADLCTSGGVNGVLSGKHYNRAWSVHECFSEALHRLFYEAEPDLVAFSDSFEASMKKVIDEKTLRNIIEHPEFLIFKEKYENLQNQYLNGEKGKTPQIWMYYLRLMEIQHLFHYSINVNDFYLRLHCWKLIVQLCFVMNKIVYGRYGGYYVRQLENLHITHPGAVEEICTKGISVRRNDIGIGQSIDGAGEQTFMRSAKTTGGIKNFTTNDGTYDKWIMSRPYQAKYVEALLAYTGLGDKDNTRKCLRKTEIIKSEERVSRIKSVLQDTFVNPFSPDLEKDKLYNIASGCPTREDIYTCLSSVEERGQKLYSEFSDRLNQHDPPGKNIWDPIKQQEWKDFTDEFKKAKIKTKKGNVLEITVQRDVLGLLLAKSQELGSPVNIEEALKYPLLPRPPSIAFANGTKRRTNKSALFDYAFVQSVVKEYVEVTGNKAYILDLAALLRSIVCIPPTFEELALKIYNDIPPSYKTVYVACDTYRDISIKAPERKSRGESNKFLIRSGKVRIPQDFQKILCNGDNKERLFELIEEIWVENKEDMNTERTIYFARKANCIKITQCAVTEVDELKTDHEEADTKIAYLAEHASLTTVDLNEICIRSSSGDIDIPVILTGTLGDSSTRTLIDNGTGKHRKTIRIDNPSLTPTQQKALIGFHAFTGNDYVSSFLRKTKRLWQTLVKDDEEMLNFFAELGVGDLTEDMYANAEKVVCRMYGEKKLDSVNELRGKMFWSRLRKNGKVVDLSLLPPCSTTLRKHTARAHHIAKIWKHATEPLQCLDSFQYNGWLEDGNIDWIDQMFPEDLVDIFTTSDDGAPDENVSEELEFDDSSDIEEDDN